MADESIPPTSLTKERDDRHQVSIIIKVIQVAISIIIIGLMIDPLNSFMRISNLKRTLDDVAIIYITVSGYMLINVIFIIGYCLGDRIPKKTATLFATVGSLLHIAAASVMVHNWRKMTGSYIDFQNNATFSSKQYNDMLISASVFTFINAAVFAADGFLIMKLT